jgi:hypothetical protein
MFFCKIPKKSFLIMYLPEFQDVVNDKPAAIPVLRLQPALFY